MSGRSRCVVSLLVCVLSVAVAGCGTTRSASAEGKRESAGSHEDEDIWRPPATCVSMSTFSVQLPADFEGSPTPRDAADGRLGPGERLVLRARGRDVVDAVVLSRRGDPTAWLTVERLDAGSWVASSDTRCTASKANQRPRGQQASR